MIARLLFLFALLIGIAAAPVRPAAACAVVAPAACDHCCAKGACCAASETPAHPTPFAPAGSSSEDGKQLAPPSLVLLSLRPLPAAEPPAVQRFHAARLPALPLLDLNCVRLI